MHVIAGLDQLDHSQDAVFAVVGVFDGLHLGHAYLLRHLVAEAATRNARPVVITFDHHPDEVLVGNAPPLLCDPEERLERLAAAGVDTTIVVHFDRRLRETPYDAFVSMIARRAPVAGFLMTPDTAFGYRRAGTPETLAALGRQRGFEVVVVPPFDIDGQPVSSTQVRAAIAAGDLPAAARMLGRHHGVVGEAAGTAGAGVGAGTTIRFQLPVALPPDGRYRVRLVPVGGDPSRVRGPSERDAVVEGNVVSVAGAGLGGRVRLEFLAGPG